MSTIKAEKLQSLGSKLNFLTGATPTQRLTIDENGKVGIGTATPTLALQVVGSIAAVGGAVDYPVQVASNAIFVGGAGSPDSGRIIIGDGTGWKYKISNRINSITTDIVTFDDRGMVGIGFTSPDSPLHVLGAQNYGGEANSGIVTIGNANNSRQINLGVSDTNSAVYIEGWIPGTGGSNLVLQPTEGGGKVGIGVAAPAVALDIAGEARSSTSTTATSNAKTLTTKDYVENLNRLGSVICCLITYADSSSSTHLSRYGITKSANTYAFNLPTGNWTGYIIGVGASIPAANTNSSGISSALLAGGAVTTYSNTFGTLTGAANAATPTNNNIAYWDTPTEVIVINLVRTA